MANEKPKAETAAATPPPQKSRRRLVVGAALIVLIGGVGAWLALRPTPGTPDAAAGAAPERAAPKTAPIYYKFDPPFVVNFGQEGNTHYLQLTVETMARDAAVIEAIKTNEPAIRNDLILLFSAQQYDALVSAAGKEQLRADTLAAIRKVAAAEGARAELIEAIYFTSFVIQ